jgi:cell wall-associated NlpC family hydrolase
VRRLILIASAGCIALGLVSITALSALADTSATRQPPGGAPALENTSTYDVEAQAAFISQGSAIGASSAELAAVRTDVAEEEALPDYSQVVDNGTKGRFSAPDWQERSGGTDQISHGGSYVRSGSGGQPARFKVRIPTSSDYTVYGWWPALSESSEAARFGIDTAAGRRWTTVDQTVDGGMWVKLGTYAMKKGERTIQLSAGDSVADAVAVVRGDVTMPPNDGEAITAATRKAGTFSATSVREPTRRDVVRVARRWMYTPYKWGTCTRSLMSCTCETKKTYRRFGHKLSMGETSQWRYDRGVRKVRHKYNLRRGDEVFFKEGGHYRGISHVGVYSGNGNLVHASVYYGKVVESEMKWIDGYFGAKRYRLR